MSEQTTCHLGLGHCHRAEAAEAEVERLTAALAERDRRIEKVRALIDERSHEAIVGMQRIIVVPAHVMRAALRGESDE